MTLDQQVLLAALRARIGAADAAAGIGRLGAALGGAGDSAAIRAAVDRLMQEGLIRDPVRIEPGALQCRWRLELTPEGYAAIRPLLGPERG